MINKTNVTDTNTNDMSICPICHIFFPSVGRKKYCNEKCRYVAYKRKLRLDRQLSGNCPQCGKPYDGPLGTYKNKTSYCSHCQKYYHNRYISIK